MSSSTSTPQRFNNSLLSKTTTTITKKYNLDDKVESIMDNSHDEIIKLRQENFDLLIRCEKAETESAKRQDGLVEMDILLTGYQLESERSLKEVEILKSKQKKLTDFLSKIYGRSWEEDLALQLQTALPSTPISLSTPIYRRLGVARPSLTGTPITSTFSNSISTHCSSTTEETARNSTLIEQEENRVQMEMVQALIKGYEDRVKRREIELNTMERKAKEESEIGRNELEDLRVLISREMNISL